jgi:hypothetical protein
LSLWPFGWENILEYSSYYSEPPLTDDQVREAEEKLGFTLPSSYLKMLRVTNGGRPKRRCFPKAGTSTADNHIRIERICGIGGSWGIESDEFGSQHAIRQAGFPEVGIFIAWTVNAGHDGVMLDYSDCGPRGEPRVIFVDPEESLNPVQIIASNFEAFIKGLVDCRPFDQAIAKETAEWQKRMKQQG